MPKSELNKDMGHKLSHFRRSHNWSQMDFAKELNTSQARVSQMEHGNIDVDAAWLIQLAKKYRLNPMFVLGLSRNIYLKDLKQGYGLNDRIPFMSSPVLDSPNVGDED